MSEENVTKIVDVGNFLVSTGLLFEINRKVLHPLGLAMEVTIEDENTSSISSLWDCRQDPEGVLFGEEVFNDGKEKLQSYMEDFGTKALKSRKELLGFIEQV